MTEVSVSTSRARTDTFASDKHPLLGVPQPPIKEAAAQRFSDRPTLLPSRVALDAATGRLQFTRLPEQPLAEQSKSPITQSNQPPKDLS